jgi:hypothetical protein
MRGLFAALALLGGTFASREACALEAPTGETRSEWYGWQTLIIDGVAVASLPLAYYSPPVIIGSLTAYTLGPPIVHLAHGKVGTAFGSLGLRVGMPLVGAFVGQFFGHTGEWGNTGAYVGGLVGAIGAQVIDATVLTFEDVPGLRTTLPLPNLVLRPGYAALGFSTAF